MSKITLTPHASGTGTLNITAPNTNSTRTLTLPDADLNLGNVLTTASSLASDNLTGTVPSSAMPAGSVLQVLQSVKTDIQSTISKTLIDITDLSVTITPTSSSSKFLIMLNVMIATSSYFGYLTLLRDTTPLFLPDAAGVRPQFSLVHNTDPSTNGNSYRSSITVLDAPATVSTLTYKVQGAGRLDATNGYLYINSSQSDRDNASYDARGASSITVMEIAG